MRKRSADGPGGAVYRRLLGYSMQHQGMFALAIWDDRTKTLFCTRDHVGIKPFYYAIHQGLDAVAQRIKQHNNYQRECNRESP